MSELVSQSLLIAFITFAIVMFFTPVRTASWCFLRTHLPASAARCPTSVGVTVGLAFMVGVFNGLMALLLLGSLDPALTEA